MTRIAKMTAMVLRVTIILKFINIFGDFIKINKFMSVKQKQIFLLVFVLRSLKFVSFDQQHIQILVRVHHLLHTIFRKLITGYISIKLHNFKK